MSNKSPKVNKAGKRRGTPHNHKKKTRIWTAPVFLGIAISLVALVELRPQISVLADGPLLENSQPFTAPFRITNTGYLAFELTSINCYIADVEVTGPPSLIIRNSLYDKEGWDGGVLDRAESKTVACKVAKVMTWPTKADIVMVVDYTFLGYRGRRYFRFVGSGPTENWRWLAQPSSDIRKQGDAEILKWKGY